jgi:hypothetical protein
MKHPARAAGRYGVAVLDLEATEATADSQNKEEGPHPPAFIFVAVSRLKRNG